MISTAIVELNEGPDTWLMWLNTFRCSVSEISSVVCFMSKVTVALTIKRSVTKFLKFWFFPKRLQTIAAIYGLNFRYMMYWKNPLWRIVVIFWLFSQPKQNQNIYIKMKRSLKITSNFQKPLESISKIIEE